MARDFARKARPASARQKTSNYHWTWLLAGMLIGLVISTIAFFKLFPVFYPSLAQFEEKVSAVAPSAVPKKSTRAPQFDFYSLLPELEVKVAPTEKKPAAAASAQEEEPLESASAIQVTYRLQLASFRKHAEADRLKAQMALTGMEVEIETITLAPNDIWYRVCSLSYPNRASAESVRAQLQTQSINSLLLEERG